jgi:hypothetical protein
MLPLLPLLQLSKVNWWRTATVGAAGVIVVMVIQLASQGLDLRKVRLAYENPKSVKTEKRETSRGPSIRREGPSRIETFRTVGPDGTLTEVKVETKGPVEEATGAFRETLEGSSETMPVFPPLQLDRWIAGGGPSWRSGEVVEWSFVGGRSWGNRIDLTGEVSQRGRVGARIAYRF